VARFRLAKRAETDLDEIWFTIAIDNVNAADRTIDTLHEVAGLLSSQPRMGRERAELEVGLRSVVTSTPYVIYYKPAPDGIVIVRILHHARDVDAIFLSEREG
jgi:toxin ParE1/3/4